jgi:ABC-type nitrate/sulfonate/bicarbonate transport system substrate-binding protein
MRDDAWFHGAVTRAQFVAGGAALTLALAASRVTAGAQTVPLRLNIFGGLDAWPVYVMHDKGLMTAAGFDLAVTPTPGSVPQFKSMMAGDADLALTAMDNIVAYDEGQGDPSITGDLDFTAILGIGPGFLKLVTRPEITSYEQMRGKAFAVDAVGTGFSFVLRRMLEKNGIMPGDYSFVALGSTQKRFDGIASGQCVGGVVGAPFDVLGQQKYGLHVFGSAIDVLGHYQATVIMARRSWARTHKPAIAAFVRAYRAAVAWLYDPANRTEATAILARNTDLPADIVTQAATATLASPASYSRTGAFDVAGVNTVMELRAAYAVPKKPLADAAKYIDRSYL